MCVNMKTNIEKSLEKLGLKVEYMNVQKYALDNDFFTMHDEIYDSSEYWFEDIEVDFDIWFHNECPRIPTSAEISEEILELADIEYTTDMIDKEFKDLPEDVKIDLNDWYSYLEFDDFVNASEIQEMLDIYEEHFDELEILAYWTIYFEPRIFDEDVAHQCGLFPFQYTGNPRRDLNLLALGGCGMDLSPRLDTYQAIVSNTLPSDSKAFSDPKYFEYVSTKPLEYVLDCCKLPEPVYDITAVPE